MGKPLILGSEPEKDPLESRTRQSMIVSSDTEIDWDSRSVEQKWSFPILIGFITILVVLFQPILSICLTIIILSTLYFLPTVSARREIDSIRNSQWIILKPRENILSETDETLLYRDNDDNRHLIGLELFEPSNMLFGSLGSMIRSLNTDHGFVLRVSMRLESIEEVINQDRIRSNKEEYLESLGKSGRHRFISVRGGLWSTYVMLVGHLRDLHSVSTFEAAIHGAVPTSGWKQIENKDLAKRLTIQKSDYLSRFYALGHELSEWLVQLPSELAPEVGSNVPSEFLSPIKTIASDYPLGVAVNPETLQTGPVVGFSHNDLVNGTLVCGGTNAERKRILALLIQALIAKEKRVLLITGNPNYGDLAGLTENVITLELGHDFVLNPVDPDNVPRTEYVGQLISALEILAGADLTGAADLEIALNRTVAIGNTTVADVRFDTAEELMDSPSIDKTSQTTKPSNKSLVGLDAVRLLHEGSGARAFYGTQTIPIRDFTKIPYTVLTINLGSVELDTFAFDLLMMKLAGLKQDSDFVVIFNEPLNLVARNRRHYYRIPWIEFLAKRVKKRGPLVVAMEHPADFSPATIGLLTSCVSSRLRESVDVKEAVDLLGLSVIQTGMHSKARHSSRETSFLRVIPDGMAVIANTGGELGYPVKLNDSPDLSEMTSTTDVTKRLAEYTTCVKESSSRKTDSLIEHVMGRDYEHGIAVLRLLQRYEPLTQEAVRKFISTTTDDVPDIEAILMKLERGSLILKGHEIHSGVSYLNYRLTMKGTMALRQNGEDLMK
ncbi:MAG: hypothetical protein BAJATHORv1_40148 [Candidatus Thorarchaeota archaeon]|nr:MAG: hypothetical protein BAJATHORv1_40148 [Candidatus Thorarchaeota archaeon]